VSTGPGPVETAPGGRVLVAGIGNIFLGDDGFGVETVRRLGGPDLPPGVEVQDTGVRGVHLAYQLLDGYRAVVLVDAVAGDDPPGTLRVLEPDAAVHGAPDAGAVVDGHRMTPDTVLGLLGTLTQSIGAPGPERVLVVGCVPESIEEGIGLSTPVAAAVDEAARLVRDLVRDLAPDPAGEASSATRAG
jgi:hydrogenase maturation protease